MRVVKSAGIELVEFSIIAGGLETYILGVVACIRMYVSRARGVRKIACAHGI